jgi:outer membrane protein
MNRGSDMAGTAFQTSPPLAMLLCSQTETTPLRNSSCSRRTIPYASSPRMLTRWLAAALATTLCTPTWAAGKPRKSATPEVVHRPMFRIGSAQKAPERLEVHGSVTDAWRDFFGPGRKVEFISLDEAIGAALANNLEIQFDRVGVEIEKARKDFSFGVFDPTFNITVSRDSIQRPDNTANLSSSESINQLAQIRAIQENTRALQVATGQEVTPFFESRIGGEVVVFDADTDRYQASLQGRTPWGMRYALTASQTKLRSTFIGDTRTIIPQYSAFGGFQIEQPLLRGAGPNANLAEVRLSRVNQRVAELQWRQRIAETVQAVLVLYYEMSYSMQNVRVREDSLAANQRLLAQTQRRLDLGFISPLDVQQVRVAVSTDEETLITAKSLFLERQYQLRRLITKEAATESRRIFIPRPVAPIAVPVLDRGSSMRSAYENRFDYRATVARAESADIRLKFMRNQLWPQLDVVGTYGYNGLSDDWRSARQEAYHSQAPQWSFGIQFSVPLGNIQSRAQLRVVEGFKEQAVLDIRKDELKVSVDVDTVISRIETNRQRVETARQSRALNEEAVRIANRRLDEGQISSFDVIETTRKLYEARSRELDALAALQTSVTQFWLATGTVLDRTGISFKTAEGRPVRR